MVNNFSPRWATLNNISATDTSASTQVITGNAFINSVILINTGTKTVFVKSSKTGETITVNDGMAILPGMTIIIGMGDNQYINTICETGETTILQAIAGVGI